MEKIISQNLDANESAFFARELESIKSKTYDIKYPNLKATMLIPVSLDAGSGAETITYQQFNQAGIMKIIANYADDLPRSDVFGKEFTSKVKSLGGSYGYNVQEIRAAKMAGRSLTDRKATSVRKANDQAVNRIGWFGDASSDLLGFLNQPNVPAAVVPAGVTTSNVKWDGATPKNPEEILQDMNDAVTRIIEITLGAEVPNTMLLPVAQYQKISTTRLAAGTDTTIKEFFMKNNPSISKIEWVNELKDVSPAPSGGASPTDVMIVYDRSPEVLSLEIPQPFEQFPAQERNLEFVVPAHSRIGGVIVYYPLAIDISEGI
ncbi:MAG: DUF2184 domain-containing protein [Scytonema sp. CRU_2_7]|nr:DUF2184 domain-containing protein [Scytonema sp. CRU_2_7]